MQQRLIAQDPGGVENSRDLYDETELVHWDFGQATLPPGWNMSEISIIPDAQARFCFGNFGEDPELIFKGNLDASRISTVEVAYEHFGRGRLRLEYRGDQGEGTLDLDAQLGGDTDPRRLDFELEKQTQWKGTIKEIRLSIEALVSKQVRIETVRCLHRSLRPDVLERAAEQGMRVQIGADSRLALPSLPSHPIRLRQQKQKSRLCFGTGVLGQGTITFFVRDSSHERELWSTEQSLEDGWVDNCVQLPQLADSGRSLSLLTRDPSSQGTRGWYADPRIEVTSAKPPPNIILISMDTLRADQLSCYGRELRTSPNLDAWTRSHAVLFEDVVAAAPWTLPSHCSMFSGLDAIHHGVNHHQRAPDSLLFIAEILRKHGYRCAAITGGGILRPYYGFTQGFDSFRYWAQKNSSNELETHIEDARRFIRDNRDRPFFLFFHTYEIHYPHRRRQPYFDQLATGAGFDPVPGRVRMLPPKIEDLISAGNTLAFAPPGSTSWHSPLSQEEKKTLKLMYDSAVAFSDARLQTLFETLNQLGIRNRSMIILTSDHGEALGEGDRGGHSYLEDYNIKVPLIIEFPGDQNEGTRIPHQVRSIDIMPTILEVAGIEPPPGIDGRSLRPFLNTGFGAFPKEAWSYAASSNRGLALRKGTQGGWVFNDAAWRRLWGSFGAFRPGEDIHTVDQDAHWEQIRSQVGKTFRGLRVFLWNHGPGVLEGRLSGSWNQRTKVKSSDASSGVIRWKQGQGFLRLKEDQELELLISGTWNQKGGIQGSYRHQGERPFSLVFEDGYPSQNAGLYFENGGWSEKSDIHSAAGIQLRFRGPLPLSGEKSPLREEARRQLEALGYIAPK